VTMILQYKNNDHTTHINIVLWQQKIMYWNFLLINKINVFCTMVRDV
jgi:hypothetical protein